MFNRERMMQDDREAAAALYTSGLINVASAADAQLIAARIIAGQDDGDPVVQSYARHRATAEPAGRAPYPIRNEAELALVIADQHGPTTLAEDLRVALADDAASENIGGTDEQRS